MPFAAMKETQATEKPPCKKSRMDDEHSVCDFLEDSDMTSDSDVCEDSRKFNLAFATFFANLNVYQKCLFAPLQHV